MASTKITYESLYSALMPVTEPVELAVRMTLLDDHMLFTMSLEEITGLQNSANAHTGTQTSSVSIMTTEMIAQFIQEVKNAKPQHDKFYHAVDLFEEGKLDEAVSLLSTISDGRYADMKQIVLRGITAAQKKR